MTVQYQTTPRITDGYASSETAHVKSNFERFRAAKAKVVREPYDVGGGSPYWITTFADPDDNYFQLMSPM